MNRSLFLTLLVGSSALAAQAAPTPAPTKSGAPTSTKATASNTTGKATHAPSTTPVPRKTQGTPANKQTAKPATAAAKPATAAAKPATKPASATKATPTTQANSTRPAAGTPKATSPVAAPPKPTGAVATPKPTPKVTPKPAAAPSTPVAAPSAPGAAPGEKASGVWTPAKLFDPAAISQFTLPNGVRGVVRETYGTGLVSVQVWVKAGSRYEQDANNGASHLIESLAMQASQNYPRSLDGRGGASDAIEALGGTTGTLTSRDSTFYNATVAAAFLPAALRALSDATLRPRLTDSAVEEGKFEVQLDLQGRERDPLSAVVDLAYRATFVKHPYKRPAGGTLGSVENLTPARVRQYYKERYIGSNISVVIVGDVDRSAAHKLIAQSFGGAPKGSAKPVAIPQETSPKTNRVVTRQRPINRSAIALAFRSPGITSEKDVVAMDVLLAHWREGSDAALGRVLLGKKEGDASPAPTDGTQPPPLAVGFDVDYLTQRDPGLFIVSLVVEPENRQAAVKATLDAISTVQTNGLDSRALQRAKAALSRQYMQQSETVSGQAGALGFYEMINDYRFAMTYLDRVSQITSADIQRVAKKYLSRSAYIQVVIEPSPLPPGSGGAGNAGSITARVIDSAATFGKKG